MAEVKDLPRAGAMSFGRIEFLLFDRVFVSAGATRRAYYKASISKHSIYRRNLILITHEIHMNGNSDCMLCVCVCMAITSVRLANVIRMAPTQNKCEHQKPAILSTAHYTAQAREHDKSPHCHTFGHQAPVEIFGSSLLRSNLLRSRSS